MKNNKKIWIPIILVIALVAILIGSIFGYKAIIAKEEVYAKEEVFVKITYIQGGSKKEDNITYNGKNASKYKTFGSLIEKEKPDGFSSNPFSTDSKSFPAFGSLISNYKGVDNKWQDWTFYIYDNSKYNPALHGIDQTSFSQYKFGVEEKGTDINNNY